MERKKEVNFSSFRDLALARKSIREYKDKEIDSQEILELLETAILAPSAGNLQSWEFVIIKSKEAKKQIAQIAFGQDFIAKASHLIVIFANKNRASTKYGKRGEFYSLIDAAIAGAYLQLAAAEKGYGTVWIGAFDTEKLKSFLNAPEYVEPIGIIPIGIPAESGRKKERRPVSDFIHYERF